MSEKTVLITGGTGNLGIHLARDFAKDGWGVVITSRHQKNAQDAAEMIYKESGQRVFPLVLDLAQENSIDDLIKKIEEGNLRVTALINNAAVDNTDDMSCLTYSNLSNVLGVNFAGTAWLARSMSEYWKRSGMPGSIVNISSLLSKYGAEKSGAYAASKAALESFARCLAIEYGHAGIRVNTVRIAGMRGNLIQQYAESRVIKFHAGLSNNKNDFSKIPLRRCGDFSDFTKTVLFLASENAAYITGQEINIDGGASSMYPAYSVTN